MKICQTLDTQARSQNRIAKIRLPEIRLLLGLEQGDGELGLRMDTGQNEGLKARSGGC